MESITLKLTGHNDFSVQEAYKVLRTNVLFSGQHIKVISLTSCDENEGKTTVSLHLAKSFADLGRKVLFIDADMRKSVIVSRNTTAKNIKGLSEVLTGMSSLDECLYATQYDKLHILFAGKYPPNPVELLNSKYFSQLVANAKEVYDYVIIDTPPLGRVIDAAVVSSVSDGTILVMGNARTRAKKAKGIVAQLEMSSAKVLGVVRNYTSKNKNYSKYGYEKYKNKKAT